MGVAESHARSQGYGSQGAASVSASRDSRLSHGVRVKVRFRMKDVGLGFEEFVLQDRQPRIFSTSSEAAEDCVFDFGTHAHTYLPDQPTCLPTSISKVTILIGRYLQPQLRFLKPYLVPRSPK